MRRPVDQRERWARGVPAEGISTFGAQRTDGTEGGLSLAGFNPSLSADGKLVAFESEADLAPDDTGFPVDVYTHAEP